MKVEKLYNLEKMIDKDSFEEILKRMRKKGLKLTDYHSSESKFRKYVHLFSGVGFLETGNLYTFEAELRKKELLPLQQLRVYLHGESEDGVKELMISGIYRAGPHLYHGSIDLNKLKSSLKSLFEKFKIETDIQKRIMEKLEEIGKSVSPTDYHFSHPYSGLVKSKSFEDLRGLSLSSFLDERVKNKLKFPIKRSKLKVGIGLEGIRAKKECLEDWVRLVENLIEELWKIKT